MRHHKFLHRSQESMVSAASEIGLWPLFKASISPIPVSIHIASKKMPHQVRSNLRPPQRRFPMRHDPIFSKCPYHPSRRNGYSRGEMSLAIPIINRIGCLDRVQKFSQMRSVEPLEIQPDTVALGFRTSIGRQKAQPVRLFLRVNLIKETVIAMIFSITRFGARPYTQALQGVHNRLLTHAQIERQLHHGFPKKVTFPYCFVLGVRKFAKACRRLGSTTSRYSLSLERLANDAFIRFVFCGQGTCCKSGQIKTGDPSLFSIRKKPSHNVNLHPVVAMSQGK